LQKVGILYRLIGLEDSILIVVANLASLGFCIGLLGWRIVF